MQGVIEQEAETLIVSLVNDAGVKVTSSQIWSLDDLGFHLAYQSNADFAPQHEIARKACLQNEALRAGTTAAFPFILNKNLSGVLVVASEQPLSDEGYRRVLMGVSKRHGQLEALMSTRRYLNLSILYPSGIM